MLPKFIITFFIFFSLSFVHAQQLLISPGVRMPSDSAESMLLKNSLDSLLRAAQGPNERNQWVLPTQRAETFILLDEINGIENEEKWKDTHFYKPYLSNVVSLCNGNYLMQVFYIGQSLQQPILRAGFELIAHRSKAGVFLFSSPLVRNTAAWHKKKMGHYIFHYQQSINNEKVKEFAKLCAAYDQKLKLDHTVTDLYCTENSITLLKLIGVLFKSDYNGIKQFTFASSAGMHKLLVLGDSNAHFDHFDPHDLWHDRRSLVVLQSDVNKAVDEGCAYAYGGSWEITWGEIFKEFKRQVAIGHHVDWVAIKEKPVYFQTMGHKNAADYVVNALLVKKIEREKGFAGVWELLNSAKVDENNDRYYVVLEKLTGINKTNYNQRIQELIDLEQ